MFTTDGIEAPIDSHDGPVRYNRSLGKEYLFIIDIVHELKKK